MPPPDRFITQLISIPDDILKSFVDEPQPHAGPQAWRRYHDLIEDKRRDILKNHIIITPTSLSLEDVDLQRNDWSLYEPKYWREANLKIPVQLNVAGVQLTYEIGHRITLEYAEGEETGEAYLPPFELPQNTEQGGGTRSKTRRTRRKNRKNSRNKRRVRKM